MSWQSTAILAAIAVPFAAMLATPPRASETPRISGPHTHENLTVFFLHGTSLPGPAPLTLKEAMEQGKVVVHETSKVNELAIENTGSEEIFVQTGDIVKGGQQDRVLTVSFLVPPKSGRVPIAAYCVEQGRWSARGKEDVKRFASADKAVPSREAKLAMMAPAKPADAQAAPPASQIRTSQQQRSISPGIAEPLAQRAYTDTSSRQSGVWASVAEAQRKLSANTGGSVAAAQSASSLQLSLENKKLEETRAAYVKQLNAAGKSAGDIVGFVFAVNGKLNSGDVYPSNALFGKMWDKLIEAAATEAIAHKDGEKAAAPTEADVKAFLARAEAGNTSLAKIDGTFVKETRDADGALFQETRKAAGGFVHRAYLAK